MGGGGSGRWGMGDGTWEMEAMGHGTNGTDRTYGTWDEWDDLLVPYPIGPMSHVPWVPSVP